MPDELLDFSITLEKVRMKELDGITVGKAGHSTLIRLLTNQTLLATVENYKNGK